MNLTGKLLQIQQDIDGFVKDGKNESEKYNYVSSDAVLDRIRPRMNELSLLLVPEIKDARMHEGQTRSGTVRFFTELDMLFTWIDCESDEKLCIPWYAQGVDLAGEKGVGKALTYAEKYFLLKFFHVPTSKDDPDSDGRTKTGEKKQRGTQAAAETLDYQRQAIAGMLGELCIDDTGKTVDAAKVKASLIAFTKAKDGTYAGVDSIEALNDAQVRVVYGKAKTSYKKRTGRDFVMEDVD